MKYLRIMVVFFLFCVCSQQAFAQAINVYINVRGNTGIEGRVKNIMAREFRSFDLVTVTQSKNDSHLYLDISIVEQEPINFYGLGISIAYRVKDNLYSRPTSDVSQFGRGRMEEVCVFLASEIEKTFVEPLRHPDVPAGKT